jgi:hypothetical protein
MPRLSELLGFTTTTPRPAASGHPNGAGVDPPGVASGTPTSALASTAPASDPTSARTVVMASAAIGVYPTVAPVVAPATSRSHVVPSVVAPATSRSTRSVAPATPARFVAAPAQAPAPPLAASPDPASTATTDPGATSPAAPRAWADRQLPADGGIFVGSQSPRRPGSLVSRVRRRQAAVDEPGREAASVEAPVEEAVTVISRSPRRDPAPEPWTPPPRPAPQTAAHPGLDWGSDTRIEMKGAGRAGAAPYAGEEPTPGHTVVLEGDDVEAWVRERLYGGRLPTR